MSVASAPPHLFAPPDEDYPLRRGGADALTRRDSFWLAGLLLVALVPRLMVAAQLGPVCDDGYFYLAVADAYDRGELTTALWYLNVNLYPVLLAQFDRVGLDPLAAAKVWGVVVATLALLPLFGWLRRLLDRRVALAACGLYAVHPEFIEVSPEPIRDATFWLLTALSLYFLWRAAAERRLPLFAAGGLAIALAAHTRSEGWLLMLPAAAWPLVRWKDAAGERLRLASGMVLAFAMTPLLVVLLNVTALRQHDRWEWGKLEHFALPYRWAAGLPLTETPPQSRAAPHASAMIGTPASPTFRLEQTAPALAERFGRSTPRSAPDVRSYLDSLAHSLEPVTLLLMLIGSIAGRRLLLRREHLVLSAICIAVLLGVWVRQVTLGEINGRYFLACFFPASGAAGIGVLWALSRLEQIWRFRLTASAAAMATTVLAVLVGGAHVAEAVTGEHPSRSREAAIGQMLRSRLGDERSLVVLPHACRVGYYAGNRLPIVVLDNTPIESLLARHHGDVVILEHRYTPADRCADLARRLIAQGWEPFDLADCPESSRFVVLIRREERLSATQTRAHAR